MGDHSAIEWTEATWNPTTGCDKTSPGCDNCYALTLSKRLKAMGQAKYQCDGDPRTSGPGFGLALHPDTLDVPRSWTAPRVWNPLGSKGWRAPANVSTSTNRRRRPSGRPTSELNRPAVTHGRLLAALEPE